MEKQEDITTPSEGDTKVVDGVTYQYINSGYTIREYYAHLTPGKGPGPGWDTRAGLLDDERSMKRFGRTFSVDEVYGEILLPDTPMYQWREVVDVE